MQAAALQTAGGLGRQWAGMRRSPYWAATSSPATFEARPRAPAEIAGWLEPDLPFVVAEIDRRVVGFARVSPYSDRCVYDGVGEHGVYVDAAARGHGVGEGCSTHWPEPPKPTASTSSPAESSPPTPPAAPPTASSPTSPTSPKRSPTSTPAGDPANAVQRDFPSGCSSTAFHGRTRYGSGGRGGVRASGLSSRPLSKAGDTGAAADCASAPAGGPAGEAREGSSRPVRGGCRPGGSRASSGSV